MSKVHKLPEKLYELSWIYKQHSKFAFATEYHYLGTPSFPNTFSKIK